MSDSSQRINAAGRRVLLPNGRRQMTGSTCCCAGGDCDGYCLCAGSGSQVRSIDVAITGVLWQQIPGWALACGDPGWVNRTIHLPALDTPGYTWSNADISSGCYCTDACYGMVHAAQFVADGTNGTTAGQVSCCDLSVCASYGSGGTTSVRVDIGYGNCTGGGGLPTSITTATWDCTGSVTAANTTTSLAPTSGGFYGGSITVTPSGTRPYPLSHTFTSLGALVGTCCGGDAPAP